VASRPHKNYLHVVKKINEVAGGLQPRQLNAAIFVGLWAGWKKTYSHNTLYTFTGILRRLLKHLESYGAPHLLLPHVSGPRARPNIATPEQMQAIVSSAAPWLRLFILLCWQTALRFSEAYRVSPRSYDKTTRTISIMVKGGKNRVLPVTSDIEVLLGPTLEGDPDKSCIALLKGGRCSPAAVRAAWSRLTREMGISEVNPHDLRRTTLTNLYRESKDLRACQQFAGHRSMTSTLNYLAPLKEEQLRDYYKLLKFHEGKPN
jgi:integrase